MKNAKKEGKTCGETVKVWVLDKERGGGVILGGGGGTV